jgi:hypothetical protein
MPQLPDIFLSDAENWFIPLQYSGNYTILIKIIKMFNSFPLCICMSQVIILPIGITYLSL